MKPIFEKIINFVYNSVLILVLAGVVCGSTLYVKSIKDKVNEAILRQQEFLDNQVHIYNTTVNDLKSVVFLLSSQDKLLSEHITTLAEKYNKLTAGIKTKNKKPSYEYLKSITTFHFRHVPGVNRGYLGTGVIVKIAEDFTYILTNKHVIDGCPNEYKCIIVNEDDSFYNVEVVKRSQSDYDLALVKVSGKIPGKRAVNGISHGTYQDKVYMVGHNLGRRYLYSEGTISGYDKKLNNSLVVDMSSAPGNSGSAVINQKGELVGLIWGGRLTSVLFQGEKTPFQTIDLTHGLCVDGKVIKLFLANFL